MVAARNPAAARRKGYGFERQAQKRLKEVWPNCERGYTGRVKGDIVGCGRFSIECKFYERPEISKYLGKLRRIHGFYDLDWILLVKGGNDVYKPYGVMAISPVGQTPDDTFGFQNFHMDRLLRLHSNKLSNGYFLPISVAWRNCVYYVQPFEYALVRLKKSDGLEVLPKDKDRLLMEHIRPPWES